VTLQTGDVLGARALSTGEVMAYHNGNEVINISAANWPNTAEGGFTGLWLTSAAGTVLDDYRAGNVNCTDQTPTATLTPGTCPFPPTSISDTFNRADGTPLQGSWFGGTENYSVINNQLAISGTGESIMAWSQVLSNTQEAAVKVVRVGTTTTAIRLALKVQDGSFSKPHLLASYWPAQGRLQMLSYDTTLGYIERGSYTVTLQAGDEFGVRATSTGDITMYHNGAEVLRISAANWPNTAEGGYAGLWLTSGAGTVLDDFRAGNVNCNTQTPTPTLTLTPTSTSIRVFLPYVQK
jgi:hypothetical protein